MAVPAWTSPPTKAAGDTVTHTDLNNMMDDVRYLRWAPQCVIDRSTNQSVTTGTWTTVLYDREVLDGWSMHSTVTNTGRITIPSGAAGVYHVGAMLEFQASGSTFVGLRLRVDGATVIADNGWATATVAGGSVATHWNLAAASYVETQVFHNSGSTQDVSVAGGYPCMMWAVWLGATS